MRQVISPEAAAEFRRRHDALVAEMRATGHSRLVLTGMESLFYLTGATVEPLERPFFLVLDASTEDRWLLVPELERGHLTKAWGTDRQRILSYREFPAPPGERWIDVLEPLLAEDFAVEPATPADVAAELLARGGRLADVLRPVRLVKSDYEVARIEVAARYARLGVEKLLASAYRGSTVAEGFMTSNAVLRAVIGEQADYDPLATKITVAPWPAPVSSEPHAIPSPLSTLDEGPHVVMALTRVNGYAAECERTFFTAPPTADQVELFATMLGARALAYSMIRPGVRGAEIDTAVNEHLAGLGHESHDRRLHRTGHGFGLSAHEPPWLAVGSDDVLRKNMLVSVEPGIYLDGVGGYRHSDTVLVTDDGHRSLTPTADDLESLTLRPARRRDRLRGRVMRRVMGFRS